MFGYHGIICTRRFIFVVNWHPIGEGGNGGDEKPRKALIGHRTGHAGISPMTTRNAPRTVIISWGGGGRLQQPCHQCNLGPSSFLIYPRDMHFKSGCLPISKRVSNRGLTILRRKTIIRQDTKTNQEDEWMIWSAAIPSIASVPKLPSMQSGE